jgi:uncharacterized protein (TIGR02147 family)
MDMTYRDILNQALEDRCTANGSYTMRAFARDLGIPISSLSEILNGKKGLSPKRSLHVAKVLKLPDWQTHFFFDLVSKSHAKSPKARYAATERLRGREQKNQVHLVNQSAIKSLTSWIDLAILELTHLENFQPNARWAAERLLVDKNVVTQSLERLKKSQLLKIDSSTGAWIDASPLFSTTDGIPSEAIRTFHKSVLSLAIRKLESSDLNNRTVKTVVFSISKDRLPRAQKILDEAVAKIVSLANENARPREDVMCFSAQLFSLLNKKEKS